MRNPRTTWVLAGMLCLALWSASFSQGILWETYNDAGMEAYKQGDYTKAEKLWVAALKEAEKFGTQDPRLATGLNNLGVLYKAQGKYSEAEPLCRRSLAIREKTLGPDHPDVATSLGNLAGLYRAQGKYGEAEPLYKRSLAIYEKALGPDHPDVATSLENYALLLRKTQRNAEAVEMEAHAKAIRDKHASENPVE